ncbi:ComEC family competence protein [Sphingobacterium sp. lm-10]|uniref:ComEC/Rec2 family competence protein n=1 Tax=Sphingobacterium sp. lm-10 TaxID=2944904 RepID=UPI002020D2F2|nr:ComEC/Rec2 family competence protein [Sphingobacterium sp. lm-10]MCL7987984.1 ComEC family competence protein [Sphingobacterium sp. lm-10]
MVIRPVISLEVGFMPFLKVLLGYLTGIILAKVFSWNYALVIFMTGVSFSFLLLLLVALVHQLPSKAIILFLYGSWISIGLLQYGQSLPEAKREYLADRDFSQLIGDVVEEPLHKERSTRLRIKLQAGIDSLHTTHEVSGYLLLTVYTDSSISHLVQYGDRVQFPANVQRVSPPYNPNEFDYRQYLANRGIYHQQRLPAAQLIVLETQTNWYTYILNLKERVVTQFRSNISDQTAFSVASALVFGYRAEMDPEVNTAFTNTGTIHILSVSGMHVSMVFLLLTFLLRPLDRWTYGKSFRFVIVLFFIWMYVMLTGMAPPILRAGIMISFFVFSQWIGRRQQGLNALFASGFCILCYDPSMLFDVGFQLSYLAMLGIFLIFPLLRSLYLPRNRWLRIMTEYSYISIAAQLVTTPLTLYYFGQFPNYFLLANLLITIPATVVMYLGVALMVLPIPQIAPLIGVLENMAVNSMVSMLKRIANLPGATSQGITFILPQVIILFFALGSFFVALNYRLKYALYSLFAALFFLVSTSLLRWNTRVHYRGLHIYQLRQHIAIAWYEKGHVFLFSTLDSLTHPSIQYAVMPDIKSYRALHQMKLVKIPQQQNYLLTIGNKVLYVWNEGDYEPPEDVGLVLVRNNRRLPQPHQWKNTMHVLDGSSSAYYVERNSAELDAQQVAHYTLKDNFAYVWKTE